MSLFSDNIKYLRIKKSVTQQAVADAIQLSRPRYAKYEDGANFPPPDSLVAISRYFNLSLDLLLTVDVRKYPLDDLLKMGDNRILLPVKVDSAGRNLIEIIPHKARAGYLTGYADPEYIENLPQISLPFLGPGIHRAFPISGDSMPPHNDTSFVVGKYVESLGQVRTGKTYILITQSEGIIYKRLKNRNENALTVSSDNIVYAPYDIKLSDIAQIWEFACSFNMKEAEPDQLDNISIKEALAGVQKQIMQVHEQLSAKKRA
jgi:transcriptional regulator with XRE-family HTH domain